MIIKRLKKTFTKSEAIFICQFEKITKDNVEFFVNQIMMGPSEIVVVSKLGAVQDAIVICSGSKTGRRRCN